MSSLIGTKPNQVPSNGYLGSCAYLDERAKVNKTFEDTGAIISPEGTSEERPVGTNKFIRYNSDLNGFEGYNGSSWGSFAGAGSVIETPKIIFPDGTSQISAADRSFRNKIINGDMAIDQERAGAAVTPTVDTYVLDQFVVGINVASKLTFQQVEDAPPGFKYSQKITVAAQYNPAAANVFAYLQRIEGLNIIDLQLGTSGATVFTLSQYIKGSVPGTYSCFLKNNAENRSYVGIINVTTSWQRVSVTLQGDVTGTWLTDTGVGLSFGIDLGSGSNFNTTADTWQAGNYLRTSGSVTFVNQPNGSTLNITGVQLEKAGAASEFEYVPYDEQLRRCQRYWYSQSQGYGAMYASTGFSIGVYFKVLMRIVPVVTRILSAGTFSSEQISTLGWWGYYTNTNIGSLHSFTANARL